jgi:hypothetical protein
MPFFAFKLSKLHITTPRGKIPDNDIVTFNVFVNQVDRGHGSGLFPALAAGSTVPLAAVKANHRSGSMSQDWIVGPLEIAPGDIIHLVYSGTNTSDSQIDLSGIAEIEIKILNKIVGAAVGAVGGLVGSAIGGALGAIGDPVGTLLGFQPQGPCNGLVFSNTVEFSGAGLSSLPFSPPTPEGGFLASLPQATEASFTRSSTDELTHDSSICGDIARTEVTFSVLQVPSVSVRFYANRIFRANLRNGLRPLAAPGAAVSIRSLLRLRP